MNVEEKIAAKIAKQKEEKDEKEVNKKQVTDDTLKDATDEVICNYLARIANVKASAIFKDIVPRKAKIFIKGKTTQYKLSFAIVNEKYDLVKPKDVKSEKFKAVLNNMDNMLRSQIIFKPRVEEFIRNVNNAHSLVILEKGSKIFLHEKKNTYYVGNVHMSQKYLELVEKCKNLPFSIGIVVENA
jgi:hypothetical protein